jgi:hypothetical protein
MDKNPAYRWLTTPLFCTGNGLVVQSSSHKREVPVRFPAGCTKTFLSPLPLSPHRLTSYFNVWRHLPSAKIRIAQNNIARVNIAPKRQHARPAHVEDNGATTTVYWRGADRGDQVKNSMGETLVTVTCIS